MKPRSPNGPTLAAGLGAGSAPLLLWAAHFAACYVAAAVGCMPAPAPERVAFFIAAATLVALAAGGVLVVQACRHVRRDAGDLLPRLRLLVAVLSWVGIAWTGAPLALLAPCG